MSQLDEIVQALSLEEAALNEFKKRKSSSNEKSFASTSSTSNHQDNKDLISFNTEVDVAQTSNRIDPYDMMKENILRLNNQQLIPYNPINNNNNNYQYHQPFFNQRNYNPNFSQQLYFTPSITRIGFENILHDSFPQKLNVQSEITNSMSFQANPTVKPVHDAIVPTGTKSSSINNNQTEKDNFAKDDLINLDEAEETIFLSNILQTFDPLISKKHSNNEEAKSSYYADQYADPFDYIYNGGTQYSDQIYEAINSNDRPVISPNQHTPENYEYLQVYSETTPPLPPRNSSIKNPNDEVTQQFNDYGTHYSKKLYENVVEQKIFDKDALAFYAMVKDLRSKYQFNDIDSNVGHIQAAQLDSKTTINATSIKLLIYPSGECFGSQNNYHAACEIVKNKSIENYQKLENYLPPIVFTCDINSIVIHIIMQVLITMENLFEGSPEDFVLKTIGSQEWLSDTSVTLSQLQYVHESIALEKDILLGFFPKKDEYLKAIARTRIDDVRDSDLKIENILPKDPFTSTSISYDTLIILLETLEMEIDKLEATAGSVSSYSSLNASGVIQACRAICSLLGCIDTFELFNAINRLRETCDLQQATLPKATAIDILSEKGNYARVSIRPRNNNEKIKFHSDEIRDAILNLLEIYTQAFQVNYSVKRPQWNSAFLKSTEVHQNVMLHLMAVHRPMQTWKFDEYMMGIQIYYGTRSIGEPLVTKCSNSTIGFFPRFTFDVWITFDDVQVSILPREARVVFVLYGCIKQSIEGSGQTVDESNQELTNSKTELGWTSLQFFEFDMQMVQGQFILSLWPPSPDKYMTPSPRCHPHADFCPVLSIEIPSYGNSLFFPQILPNENIPKLDFYSLDGNLQEELLDTIDEGILFNQIDKREVLWEKRCYLHKFPKSLPKILNTAHSWDYASLVDLHGLINNWSPLKPLTSLELLLPRFPDIYIRGQAVKWISKMTDEELIDYLPQLIQALKFDCYDSSPLSSFLLARGLQSPRVAHYLYWLLSQNLPGDCPQNNMEANQFIENDYVLLQYRFHRRNQLLLRALLAICGERLCKQILSQSILCKCLDDVAKNVKMAKDSLRLSVLRHGIENVHQILNENPTFLPLSPGKHVHGINSRTSSYFNSNTLPLKINFMGPDNLIIPAIYKCGDDLQQDMLTLQIVRIIDKMWLKEGLDLKMVTFQCVSTGRNRGMIEMVTNAETLRKIQVEWGLTGSFKDKPIAEWLQKMNENPLDYQRAVENFTSSCAGYSIITFLLGIGDRHNDNVLIQNSGHIFHIDFGKFLGDAQMFGNFRRDRTPFVLTSDMAYVINGGDRPSEKFHNFVDLCCKAFNIVRKNGDLILHIFALMASSGIPGASEAVNYVRNALMPGVSNPEAAANFAKMIHVSLKSWFTQFNFFLHNLAQIRFGNSGEGGELLSFIPKTYTVSQDGFIKDVVVYGYQKRYDLEKRYCFILEVLRQHNPDKIYLFRTYKELCEFHQKICLFFPLVRVHSLQSGISVGRSNIKTVAEKRLPEVKKFIYDLMHSSREIIDSDLVVTFFHPLLRDQQEADIRITKMREENTSSNNSNICGEIKFSIHYHRDTFIVMIHHARSLPLTTSGQEPNTYIKSYLIPDRSKITKRKTRVVKKNCFPSFMETLEYRMPLQVIKLKTLQVTVWSHDSLQENEFLGGVQIPLIDLNLKDEIVAWHQLVYLCRSY